jgi:hypothetical protein
MLAFAARMAGHLLTDGRMRYGAANCPPTHTPNVTQPQGKPNARHIQHRCLSCVELTSFLRLSASAAIRQICGIATNRLSTAGPPQPGPRGARADQRPALQALPGRNRPTGNGRPLRPWSRRTERRRRPPTEGTGASPDHGSPGPRGCARHRKPLVPAGRQRSRPRTRTARHTASAALASDAKQHEPGSNPSPEQLPRACRPCHKGSGHRRRASPSGQAGDNRRQASSTVILAGRAPDVP